MSLNMPNEYRKISNEVLDQYKGLYFTLKIVGVKIVVHISKVRAKYPMTIWYLKDTI